MIGQKGIPTTFGGVERSVEALSIRLGGMGHDVLVYTRAWYAVGNPNFSKGVRTIETPTIYTKNLDAIVHTFTSTIHAIGQGVDVFHYHGVGPALLSWIPRIFAPHAKVVVTFQCIDSEHQKWGPFARLMLRLGERASCAFPHQTLVTTRVLQGYCKTRYGADTTIISNGVSTPAARIGTDKLTKFGLEKNGYVAMVSRLVRHKGAHHLIAAYAELQKSGQTQGKKLAIVGGSAFTDVYVAELKTQASGIPGIVFTGNLSGDELAQVFYNSYAVVHPSESEGLPMSVLEAMAYGKAVLASDIPEHMEVIRDHGLPFRNKSVEDLTRKLKSLLSHPEIATEIGIGAKSFIMENYHWDDSASALNGVYGDLAASSEPTSVGKKARAAA